MYIVKVSCSIGHPPGPSRCTVWKEPISGWMPVVSTPSPERVRQRSGEGVETTGIHPDIGSFHTVQREGPGGWPIEHETLTMYMLLVRTESSRFSRRSRTFAH